MLSKAGTIEQIQMAGKVAGSYWKVGQCGVGLVIQPLVSVTEEGID